ncbi:Uncharacterised protein [Elizabethkingia meningoseptica]|nr:Uncharacterised protein [Elizabethkingia meningoseptica]
MYPAHFHSYLNTFDILRTEQQKTDDTKVPGLFYRFFGIAEQSQLVLYPRRNRFLIYFAFSGIVTLISLKISVLSVFFPAQNLKV